MEAGAGEGGGVNDADEYVAEKGDAKDFALWKAYKEEDGPVYWETALGKGRPGWHIECSAMARKFLGITVDVHAGGVDLVFPHHENEVAQSEAANGGRTFCNCWVHNGFVNVENEKMSKSKGNFVTLKGSLKGGVELRAFRYLVVTSQYRSPLNFNKEGLEGAKKTVMRLDKLRKSLMEVVEGGKEDEEEGGGGMEEVIEKALKGFEAGMADDLNTPRAAAALFALVKGAEKALKSTPSSLPPSEARKVVVALERMDEVLGIFYDPPSVEGGGEGGKEGGGPVVVTLAELPVEAQELVRRRGEAKERKEWGEADECRDALKTRFGVVLKDVKGGEVQIVREG
jgi:cysteinyl-tRNA synthetase